MIACQMSINTRKGIISIRKAYNRNLIVRMQDSYTNPYETKQIESIEIFGLTKQIHETNLWKTGLRNESTIRIFGSSGHETNPRNESLRFGFANPPAWIRKDSFRAIVLRIRQDS